MIRARTLGVFRCSVLLVALPFFAACNDAGQSGEKATSESLAAAMPATPVTLAEVSQKKLTKTVTATGAVFAQKTTDIGPLVDGIIESVFVQVGDRVEKGASLFRTRPNNYETRFRELQSGFALAESERDNARREFERSQSLLADGVISQTRLENAKTQYDVAEARLGMAHASFQRAKQDLEDTLVKAPFKGTVTRRDIDEGAHMSSRSMGPGSGTSVMQIQAIDVVSVVVLVPDVNVKDVELNAPAVISIDGVGKEITTKVATINDRIDTETRSLEVRFNVENPDYAIKPGLFARVEIQARPREITAVARSAVLGSQQSRHVFVDKGGIAKEVAVIVRDLDVDFLEIVSGLGAGDRVLAGPNLGRLYDGARIEIGAF